MDGLQVKLFSTLGQAMKVTPNERILSIDIRQGGKYSTGMPRKLEPGMSTSDQLSTNKLMCDK